jgi:transposase
MRRKLVLNEGEDAAEFRLLASKERKGLSVRRLLALALCRENQLERRAIASLCGLNPQALRDLVVRYNTIGITAIYNKKGSGKPPLLSPEKHARFKEIVAAGPDFDRDGVVRWRIVDLQARVKAEFNVDYCESSIANLLKKLNFSHISARPQHPKADKLVQEAFKKTSHVT